MRNCSGVLLIALVALGLQANGYRCSADEGNGATPAKDVFYNIPHSHWEGAVFVTREGYLDEGLPTILKALRLLNAYPNYRFTLDQACYVKPFLERYPDEEAAFRQFVREGRLGIVGGMDVMPDVNMPSGESFVRQILYGKDYFRKKLDVDVTTAWQIDTFGHHNQIPQLLKLAGFKSFWFVRGVPHRDMPAEFVWEGLDGSQIPAYWLPHSYALTYGSPKDQAGFNAFMKKKFEMMGPFSGPSGRVGSAGPDVIPPEDHVPAMTDAFNRQPNRPFELRFAVPADFEKMVEARGNRKVIRGDLNPVFQGTYSSRIELKQQTRELERLLTTAEKLGAMLQWLGMPADSELLWKGWEPMLFNQTHDLMSGVMTEWVYEDTIRGFDFSKRIAEEAVETGLRGLAERVDTRGDGVPVVVFNGLGWARTDVATVKVGFSATGIRGLKLVGPGGDSLPLQVLSSEWSRDGNLVGAEIAFVAKDVPGLGYAVYHALPVKEEAAMPVAEKASEAVLENEHYRVEFDPAGGAMTRLLVKDGNWEALRAPGNVVAREQDRGDLWELYRPLDASSHVAMTERHPAPAEGKGVFSNRQSDKPGTVTRGPVFSEFQVAHPFGKQGKFATAVRLYPGLRRVDIRTRLVNDEPFVRYRVLFPTSIEGGKSVHEIPFGAIERPAGIEFPAQNWIDYGDGQRGIALMNRGLPGNNVADGTMMLSVLRSTRIVAYSGVASGGYAAGHESSLELNREKTLEYSLMAHTGDWRKAEVYREAMAFNNPLLAVTAAKHAGRLPGQWGLLDVAAKNVVVSALKPGADGSTILRVYEASGEATVAGIGWQADVTGVEEVNLMEDPGKPLSLEGRELRLPLRPFEIKTLRVRVRLPADGQNAECKMQNGGRKQKRLAVVTRREEGVGSSWRA